MVGLDLFITEAQGHREHGEVSGLLTRERDPPGRAGLLSGIIGRPVARILPFALASQT